MSFRLRFISYFVSIEIIFIILIVSLNFSSLNSLSNTLIDEKIETSSKLFSELIEIPVISSDLATLDNMLKNFAQLPNIMAIEVINENDIVLSSIFKEPYLSEKSEINKYRFIDKKNPIIINKHIIAKLSIVYDTSESLQAIQSNKKNTFFLVFIEIIISSFVAFILGSRLTYSLSRLTESALKIEKDDQALILHPKSNYKEIVVLYEALHTMQKKIAQRNLRLQEDALQLKKSEETMRVILNSPTESIFLINIDETILEVNEIAAKSYNTTIQAMRGKKLSSYTSQKVSMNRKKHIEEVCQTRENSVYIKHIGEKVYKYYLYPILNENGDVERISLFTSDITELAHAQEELDKYVKIIDENIFISHIDVNGLILSNSKAFCEFMGYQEEDLVGKKFTITRADTQQILDLSTLFTQLSSEGIWNGETKHLTKNAKTCWMDTTIYTDYDRAGNVLGYYIIRDNITDKKMLEEMSITDSLTKLYNRRYFDQVFEKELNKCRREKKIFVLLSLDIDYFKLYNDRYGHQEGDNVLVNVAQVLKTSMKRSNDLAFRIGGEEFSVIYTVKKCEDVRKVAENLRNAILVKKIPHKDNSASEYVSASFGVVYVDFLSKKQTSDEINKNILYKIADNLLYEAKENGKNRVKVKCIKSVY